MRWRPTEFVPFRHRRYRQLQYNDKGYIKIIMFQKYSTHYRNLRDESAALTAREATEAGALAEMTFGAGLHHNLKPAASKELQSIRTKVQRLPESYGTYTHRPLV